MQKHPLLSVKEAAEALRLDERSVRDRLANGTLKGEKKMMGLREKWFVYKGSIDSALGKQDNNFDATMPENAVVETPAVKQESAPAPTAQATIERPDSSPSAQPSVPTAESQAEALESSYIADAVVTEIPEGRVKPSDALRGEWYAEDKKNLEDIVNTIMKPLVDRVTAQEREIAAKLSLLHEQEETIKDQKRQLLLLPDMEKERKELELKEHEMTALQKQLTVIAEEKAKALAAKEAEVVSLLKRAEEERVAADEVKKLAENRAKEIAGLTHHIASVEEEKQALELKAAEAAKLAADLQELKKTVEKLQTPWWKIFALGGK
jgi:hypothetical protein